MPSKKPAATSQATASHWFICPCCSKINDHFSPTCPTQSNGPTAVPQKTKDKTKKSIDNAPITLAAKESLHKMTKFLYAKLEKQL